MDPGWSLNFGHAEEWLEQNGLIGGWEYPPFEDEQEEIPFVKRDFHQHEEDAEASGEHNDHAGPNSYQALLKTEMDYHLARTGRIIKELNDAEAQGIEANLPDNPKDEQNWIKKLFEAITNVENITDKPCKNGKPAQAAQRLATGYYPNLQIELACWNIFLACNQTQRGVRQVDPHHNTRFEGIDVHPTWEHRMEKIIEVCKLSKAVCKQILDPPFISRLVDCPDGEYKMKENNKRINAERDIQNEIGRKALKSGVNVEDLAAHFKPEHTDNDIAPSSAPSKLSQVPRTPRAPRSGPRTPAPKLPSGFSSSNRRMASAKGIHATTSSTGKRKQKNQYASTFGNAGDSSDDEDDADYCQSPTPSKRVSSSRSKAKLSAPNRNIFQTPSTLQSIQIDPVHHQHTLDFDNQSGRVSAALTLGEPSNCPGDDLNKTYRDMICDILQVSRDFSNTYSLKDLRIYARAYNRQFANDDWYPEEFSDFIGKTFRLVTLDGTAFISHFAHRMYRFSPLAKARQDLLPDGIANKASPHMGGFSTHGDILKDQALGVVENPFGYHPQAWSLEP